MELSKASENIFPKTKENLNALLDYYFPNINEVERQKSFELWLEKDHDLNFALNQIEFGARFCRENEALLNMRSFSSIPAARIYYTLMSLFFPVSKWDKLTSKSHRERLKEFKSMYLNQPILFKKIDTSGLSACVYPKTKDNLIALLDSFFPEAGDAERKLSIIHFLESRETLGNIHFAAQFCKHNKNFLDEAGVSSIPSERIHDVITAVFHPTIKRTPMDYEKNGERYRKLNSLI
ncbi:MAG: hypothetical protein ACQEWD_14265 [Bacteroidota bacterium]